MSETGEGEEEAQTSTDKTSHQVVTYSIRHIISNIVKALCGDRW